MRFLGYLFFSPISFKVAVFFGLYRYHPACVGMSVEQTKQLEQFVCSDCASDQNVKKPQNSGATSPIPSDKVSLAVFNFG